MSAIKKKRYRKPAAKPGEIKIQYGKLKDQDPDICYLWGEGVSRTDSRLLSGVFGEKRYLPIGRVWVYSLLDELENRGYDLTTLKFSIRKKGYE